MAYSLLEDFEAMMTVTSASAVQTLTLSATSWRSGAFKKRARSFDISALICAATAITLLLAPSASQANTSTTSAKPSYHLPFTDKETYRRLFQLPIRHSLSPIDKDSNESYNPSQLFSTNSSGFGWSRSFYNSSYVSAKASSTEFDPFARCLISCQGSVSNTRSTCCTSQLHNSSGLCGCLRGSLDVPVVTRAQCQTYTCSGDDYVCVGGALEMTAENRGKRRSHWSACVPEECDEPIYTAKDANELNCTKTGACRALSSHVACCEAGFRAVRNSCVDIDECQQRPPPCVELCVNHVGTYECVCRERGYQYQYADLAANKTAGCVRNDPCAELSCSHGCVLSKNGSARCDCPRGQRLVDKTRCEDNPLTCSPGYRPDFSARACVALGVEPRLIIAQTHHSSTNPLTDATVDDWMPAIFAVDLHRLREHTMNFDALMGGDNSSKRSKRAFLGLKLRKTSTLYTEAVMLDANETDGQPLVHRLVNVPSDLVIPAMVYDTAENLAILAGDSLHVADLSGDILPIDQQADYSNFSDPVDFEENFSNSSSHSPWFPGVTVSLYNHAIGVAYDWPSGYLYLLDDEHLVLWLVTGRRSSNSSDSLSGHPAAGREHPGVAAKSSIAIQRLGSLEHHRGLMRAVTVESVTGSLLQARRGALWLAGLDGRRKNVLINAHDYHFFPEIYAESIAIDHSEPSDPFVFYAVNRNLYTCAIVGARRRFSVVTRELAGYVLAMDVFEDWIYYTTLINYGLYVRRKDGFSKDLKFFPERSLMALYVDHPVRQGLNTNWSCSLPCEHLCFRVSADPRASVCGCEDGYRLAHNRKSCIQIGRRQAQLKTVPPINRLEGVHNVGSASEPTANSEAVVPAGDNEPEPMDASTDSARSGDEQGPAEPAGGSVALVLVCAVGLVALLALAAGQAYIVWLFRPQRRHGASSLAARYENRSDADEKTSSFTARFIPRSCALSISDTPILSVEPTA